MSALDSLCVFCGEPIVREFNLEPSATSQTQWVKPFLKQSAAGYRRTTFGGGCWLHIRRRGTNL